MSISHASVTLMKGNKIRITTILAHLLSFVPCTYMDTFTGTEKVAHCSCLQYATLTSSKPAALLTPCKLSPPDASCQVIFSTIVLLGCNDNSSLKSSAVDCMGASSPPNKTHSGLFKESPPYFRYNYSCTGRTFHTCIYR